MPAACERRRRAARGGELEAQLAQAAGRARPPPPCRGRAPRRTPCPRAGSSVPAPSCDLTNAAAKSRSSPITSPVDFISGPSSRSTPGKRANGNTASLTATSPSGCGRMREVGQPLAGHHPRGDLGQRAADRLGDERHGAAGARIDLEDEHLAVLDRHLHVHQAAHARAPGPAPRPAARSRPRSPGGSE